MADAQNTRTLIATFNDYGTARQAARDLIDAGVPSDSVHIDSNQKTAGAGSGGYETEEHHRSGFMEWWDSLFGRSHQDHKSYENTLSSGGSILRATVPAEAVDSAVDILNRLGARDVGTPGGTGTSGDTGPIQVIEEELQVGKRAVRRGGVRIYSHVVTQPVEEQVKLREEHVNVERRNVDREISPEDVSSLRDQTLEVTEMAEEPVIAKRARVREEVVIGKETTDRTETVRDNIRRTEVEVEPIGPENQPSGATQKTDAVKQSGASPRLDMSPNLGSPNVMSGGGTTAGSGTLAGEATAGSAIQDASAASFTAPDQTADFRRHFEQNYGAGSDFESVRPAYQYGYRSAADPRYRGKSWDQVENDLRSEYQRSNPESRWDRVKDAIRYGWEKTSGRR